MVSYDHFTISLLSRLRSAQSEGLMEISINSLEFCSSFRRGGLNIDACCEAMKNHMGPGDVIEQDRESGIGLTIRYVLAQPGTGLF